MKSIAVVAGGRPNYIKLSQVIRALDEHPGIECVFIDAGQHYSPELRDDLFGELGLREPDVCFNVGSGTHGLQTSQAMMHMEEWLNDNPVDAVMVHGDMNYALGCALAVSKAQIPLVHHEAMLRSYDWRMPEEKNRILIDAISQYGFLGEKPKERVPKTMIAATVGSPLVEAIIHVYGNRLPIWPNIRGKTPSKFLATLHRPENVDDPIEFAKKIGVLERMGSEGKDIVFVAHPRTQKRIDEMGLGVKHIQIMPPPKGYKAFLDMMLSSDVVVTDSGGVQEETTILGIPCITWRMSTERPCTVEYGTNVVTPNLLKINEMPKDVIETMPPKWDGRAVRRIVYWLELWLGEKR